MVLVWVGRPASACTWTTAIRDTPPLYCVCRCDSLLVSWACTAMALCQRLVRKAAARLALQAKVFDGTFHELAAQYPTWKPTPLFVPFTTTLLTTKSRFMCRRQRRSDGLPVVVQFPVTTGWTEARLRWRCGARGHVGSACLSRVAECGSATDRLGQSSAVTRG